jgi:hypothetical protein
MKALFALAGILWVVIGAVALYVLVKFGRVLGEISAYLKEVKK